MSPKTDISFLWLASRLPFSGTILICAIRMIVFIFVFRANATAQARDCPRRLPPMVRVDGGRLAAADPRTYKMWPPLLVARLEAERWRVGVDKDAPRPTGQSVSRRL